MLLHESACNLLRRPLMFKKFLLNKLENIGFRQLLLTTASNPAIAVGNLCSYGRILTIDSIASEFS